MRRAAELLSRAAWVLRRVIGAPDYDAYLAHCRRLHPDAPPLAHDDFLRERLTARYSKPGARCC